jgi:hypothetical protein
MEFKSFTSFPPTHRKDDWRETARQRHSPAARSETPQCTDSATSVQNNLVTMLGGLRPLRPSGRRVVGSWLLQSLMRSFLTAAHVSSQAVNFPC